MRARREPLSSAGLRRSFLVMELMMAIIRGTSLLPLTCCLSCSGTWPSPAASPSGCRCRPCSASAQAGRACRLRSNFLPLATFLGQFLCLVLVDLLLHLLHQRQHVAHVEDAAGDAVGMEHIQAIRLFADADELIGLPVM